MTVFEQVVGLTVDKLGVNAEDVSLDSNFREDLGADSLDVVELVMELEDTFNIEVSDEASETLRTVGDVVRFIESKK